jgi:hypothetical protein
LKHNRYILLWLLASAALFLTCSDTPRNNPFDPGGDVLVVEVVTPPDGRQYTTGHQIVFEARAHTGYDNEPAGDSWQWKSDIAGVLSNKRKFTGTLNPGTHQITVAVSDSLGRKGSATVELRIRSANEFGVGMILPSVDTAFVAGTTFEPLAAEYVPQGYTVIGRLWDFGMGSGIPRSTQASPGPVTWSVPGIFPLSYQLVDSQGRVAADTILVEVVANGTPPQAIIASPASDTTIDVGDSLLLRAEAVEVNATIVYVSWLYPPGSGLESREDTLEVPGWVRFHQPGVYPLRFKVGDRLGLVVEDTVVVTVNDTLAPPVGEIIAPRADTSLVTGDSLLFRGRVTPAGLPNIEHVWTYGAGIGFGPDSVMEPGWKMMDSAGTFVVVYSASDASGRGAPDSVTVTVTANQAPSATITSPAGNSDLTLGQSVNFVATDSDPEGRHLTRSWHWDPLSGISPSLSDTLRAPGSKTFNIAGTFRMVYMVTDDKGLVAADTVTVTASANTSPIATITVPAADTTVWAWAPFSFAGTDSDPDGTVASRKWNFGDPGAQSTGDTTRTPQNVTFATGGTYNVIYTVTDNKNGTGSDTLRVTVNANSRPQAFILSPGGNVTIAQGDSLSFLGQEFDADGTIASRLWTYGTGSGIPNDIVSIPDYRKFNNLGTFTVIFRVVDNRGAVAADTMTVRVQ